MRPQLSPPVATVSVVLRKITVNCETLPGNTNGNTVHVMHYHETSWFCVHAENPSTPVKILLVVVTHANLVS